MKIVLMVAMLVAAFWAAPIVAPASYPVTSVLHLVGTACDGGGGGW